MGSPLRPVLAGTFMVELETRIIPTLENMVLNWKRFVDTRLVMLRMVALTLYYQSLIVSIPRYSSLTK